MLIEEKIIKILNGLKDEAGKPLTVKAEEQPSDTNPKEFIIVQKLAGGYIDRCYKTVNMAVMSYSYTLHKAALLNAKVQDCLLSYDDDDILSINLMTDYNDTLPTHRQYRYLALFNIRYY